MAVQGSSSSSAAAAAAARQAAIEAAQRAAREAAERAARAAAAARAKAQAAAKAAAAQAEKTQKAQSQLAAAKQQLSSQKRIAGSDTLPGGARASQAQRVQTQQKAVDAAQKKATSEQAKQQKLEATAQKASQDAAKAEQQAAVQARAAAERANKVANQALDKASKAQAAAVAQQGKVNQLKNRLSTDALPGMAQVSTAKQLQVEEAKAHKLNAAAQAATAHAQALQTSAVDASNAALHTERLANDGAASVGRKNVPFAGANQVRDVFDLASSNVAQQQKLLGTTAAVTPQQAALADAQKVNAAAKTGSVNGSKMLLQQLQQNADPAYRQTLVMASQQGLHDIAAAAYGDNKPGPELMRGVASNLAQAGELSGPVGSAAIARQLAPFVGDNKLSYDSTQNGKPVFNDGTLDGALANQAVQGGPSTLFRSIPAQLHAIGKADTVSWDVSHHEGGISGAFHSVTSWVGGAAGDVFHAITSDPLRTLGDLATGPVGALDFANRASNGALVDGAQWVASQGAGFLNDQLFSPITGPVNDQIGKLQPNQSYSINVDGGVNIEVAKANADAQVSVGRSKDGSYTVSAGSTISASVLGKLEIPGVDAQLGGQAEFHFDSKEDAQRAADTFVRLGASAAAGPVGPLAEGAASALDGDAGFLASHLSAINFKAGAGVSEDISSNLGGTSETGLRGLSLGASAQAAAGVRVEFDGGKPQAVVFGQQLHGEVEASGGLSEGPFAVGGKGTAGVTVTSQERVELPEGLSFGALTHPGNLIRGTQISGSVSFEFDGNVAQGKGVDGGIVGASSDHGTGRTAAFTVSGNPADIIATVAPKLLHGDFAGAAQAAGDNLAVRAETRSYDFQDSQAGVDLVVAHASVSTSHTQMNTLHEARFGGGEPPSEDEIASEASFEGFLEHQVDPTEHEKPESATA